MRRARAALAGLAAALLCGEGVSLAQERDLFDYLIEANHAQLVMLVEQELIDEPLAGRIAEAMARHAETEAQDGAERSRDYLLLEEALVAAVGPEASNLHLGRSRNDLGAAMNRMRLRDELRSLLRAQLDARSALLDLADAHLETIMPGFTHAVQAQPTTLGHYLLAVDDALGRDAARLREAYGRVNESPLGAAAITTSGFAIDRDRLAELLAFDGLVENSYDAIVIATGDSKIEVASVVSISAITVGRLAQDVLFQYDDPAPGLVLSQAVAGRSSIMPQKRNPSLVEQLRVTASDVVGRAHTATLLAHNTPLHEVRDTRQPLADHLSALLLEAERMYEGAAALARSLDVRPDR
ncbi:MAG: hypothetical protein MI723_11135, partial [Caulobacterales bacterium]|nr:hypothetical protein [Caulobacterales bacterium]